jgi:hypothetical protein
MRWDRDWTDCAAEFDGLAVERHDESLVLSRWSLDLVCQVYQVTKTHPNETGFGVAPRCPSRVYPNKAMTALGGFATVRFRVGMR